MKKRLLGLLGALVLSVSLAATVAPVAVFADEYDDEEWDDGDSWDYDGGFDDDHGYSYDDDGDYIYDDEDDDHGYSEEGQHTAWAEIHGPSDIHIQEGQSRGVSIDVDIEGGRAYDVKWSVGNAGIASISGSNKSSANIYASNPGSTSVTVKVIDMLTGDVAASYSFGVYVDRKQPSYVRVTGVSVNTGSMTLRVDDHAQLAARVYPNNATNKDINWYTSNSSVVEVHGDGVIYAKGTGDAVITARSVDSGEQATCKVHVNSKQTVHVDLVGINPVNLTVGVGQSSRIQFQVYPTNASNQNVSIVSDNTTVATVGSDGTVYGKKAGTCHIIFKALDNGKTTTANITVVQGATPVTPVAPAAGANGHDPNVQYGYLTQIAKTPAKGTCLINSTYPSAYDLNVINGIKSRPDATIIAQFPFQGHTFQMIVPSTFDMTKYAVGGYVDWLTLCNYQAQGVIVKIVK